MFRLPCMLTVYTRTIYRNISNTAICVLAVVWVENADVEVYGVKKKC